VLAVLVTDVAFGMLSRVVPQLNVYAVGFPIKVGVALIAVTASLPFLGGWLGGQLSGSSAAPYGSSSRSKAMADADRTEKATPKHRNEARKKSPPPKSSDLNGAIVLIAGFVAVLALGGTIVSSAAGAMRSAFARSPIRAS
jgi:hypothetical protein